MSPSKKTRQEFNNQITIKGLATVPVENPSSNKSRPENCNCQDLKTQNLEIETVPHATPMTDTTANQQGQLPINNEGGHLASSCPSVFRTRGPRHLIAYNQLTPAQTVTPGIAIGEPFNAPT